MTERSNPLTIYLTDSEKARMEEYAENADLTLSELGRAAMREYLDNDRAARIEDKLDRLLEDAGVTVSEETTHTHIHSASNTEGSKTLQRTHEIADRLRNNHGPELLEKDVDRAIEDIAGFDTRTINRYKEKLKERHHAFEHPNDSSPVWYTERERFYKAVMHYAKSTPDPEGAAKEMLDEYDMSLSDVPDNLKMEVLPE